MIGGSKASYHSEHTRIRYIFLIPPQSPKIISSANIHITYVKLKKNKEANINQGSDQEETKEILSVYLQSQIQRIYHNLHRYSKLINSNCNYKYLVLVLKSIYIFITNLL